ncbi:uncharacterized protein N7515_003593 [Penicillium bovifimosum]|uniref:Uncharacterized protein n=1 Tax=Penicillium bovifimosum TaxID=126998 RepID=A0A9W9H4Z2_9EURO|nr:uncharacterized protein N7515_003593 [Penicillium bovifimosum]KAJ5138745.1 hypothetical protein N7515_003593 [Penicillium bovifimosum]
MPGLEGPAPRRLWADCTGVGFGHRNCGITVIPNAAYLKERMEMAKKTKPRSPWLANWSDKVWPRRPELASNLRSACGKYGLGKYTHTDQERLSSQQPDGQADHPAPSASSPDRSLRHRSGGGARSERPVGAGDSHSGTGARIRRASGPACHPPAPRRQLGDN